MKDVQKITTAGTLKSFSKCFILQMKSKGKKCQKKKKEVSGDLCKVTHLVTKAKVSSATLVPRPLNFLLTLTPSTQKSNHQVTDNANLTNVTTSYIFISFLVCNPTVHHSIKYLLILFKIQKKGFLYIKDMRYFAILVDNSHLLQSLKVLGNKFKMVF